MVESGGIAAPSGATCAGEPGPAGWYESVASSAVDAADSAASGRPAGGSRSAAAPGLGRLSHTNTHTHTGCVSLRSQHNMTEFKTSIVALT